MQASTCRRRPLGGASLDTHVHFTAEAPTPASLTSVAQKQAETQKQRVQYQLEQLCQFLEQQEQLFVTWLDEVGQTINHVRKTYGTQMTRDVAVLDELIGELEAKQCQPEWELMKVSAAEPGLPLCAVPSQMTRDPNCHCCQLCPSQWGRP